MKTTVQLSCAAAVCWLAACSAEFPLSLLDATTASDAAVPTDGPLPTDASGSDGSTADAATVDAAPADAAPVDAAPVDAAPVDAAVGCGDGVIGGAETCDDGDTDAGDGCGPDCQEENGWSCTGEPSVCDTVCGDGILAGTEVCDDNNQISGDGCSDICVIDCSNSSTTDCNPSGQTLVAGSTFVDADPPAGFVQCAGFENTNGNDVGPHWDGNCLGAAYTLRVRYWDTSASPWTLLGDGTLTPDSVATFTHQVFGATNHAGAEGFLETSGVSLLADDPAGAALPATDWSCTAGPANKHYGATDLYFANQADTLFVLVSGYSEGDDGGALSGDDDEILSTTLSYETCSSNPPGRERALAVALYHQP